MIQIILLEQLLEDSRVTANEMTEHVQQVTTKEVEAGKRLAECNRRKREELAQMKTQNSKSKTRLTYYGAGAVVAIGVLGVIGIMLTNPSLLKTNPKKLQSNSLSKLQSINLIWIRL